MSTHRLFLVAACAVAFTGCGNSLIGTYNGDIRLLEGREETDKPGYTLAETRERFAERQRSVTIMANGRAVLKDKGTTVEGDWRREGDMVIVLDDTADGQNIQKGMRAEHKFTIGKNGELIRGTNYNLYNFEEVYTKQ